MRHRHRPRPFATAICAAALAWSFAAKSGHAAADSAPGPVGIVGHHEDHVRAAQVHARLAAELKAAGFTWRTVTGSDVLAGQLEAVPWALVFIVVDGPHVAVDVALPSRAGGGTESRRVIALGASDELTPAALALRVVEALRAYLSAGAIASEAPATAVAAPPLPPPVVQASQWRPALELGGVALAGRAGLPVAYGAQVALVAAQERWRLSLTGAATWGAAVADRGFIADVAQAYALAEITCTAWPAAVVSPFITGGLGGLWMRARARADEKLLPRQSTAGSVAFAIGAGLAAAVGVPHLRLVANVRALAAASPLEVEIATGPAGRAGAPSIAALVGVQWWL